MASKLIPIPYAIFIIKPHVAINETKVFLYSIMKFERKQKYWNY